MTTWPKYPRWREMGITKPNRSRRARGKARLRYPPVEGEG